MFIEKTLWKPPKNQTNAVSKADVLYFSAQLHKLENPYILHNSLLIVKIKRKTVEMNTFFPYFSSFRIMKTHVCLQLVFFIEGRDFVLSLTSRIKNTDQLYIEK